MTVLNIAHRGARSLAPENTLPAARKGWALGADLWELDVAVTADHQLVVLHDDTLTRTSNAAQVFPDRAPWNVWDFTLDELLRLDFGAWFNAADPFGQIAAGKVSAAEQAGFAGVRIPTLREALEFTRAGGWRVNIEIKDASGTAGDGHVVEDVVVQVTELALTPRVLVSSFKHEYLRRCKSADARIITAALVEEPHPDPVALLRELGAAAYNPGRDAIDEPTVRALRAAGLDVLVWTVNDPDEMRRMMDWGVSGLFTDFPQVLNTLPGR